MPISDYGAVCDVSALGDRGSIERAQSLFDSCGLYIPSSTYSWLARTKLIEVRGQTVSYSLIKRVIQARKIYPIHLPDIYDEIARKLMFRVNHKISLTDLRALLLSSHLQIPLLTFDGGLLSRWAKHIKIRSFWSFQGGGSGATRNALELYRELLVSSNKHFYKLIENGGTFPRITEDILKTHECDFEKTNKIIQKTGQKRSNSSVLNFHYLAWNILPVIREYLDQYVLQPETVRELCERAMILVASPKKSHSEND